MSNPETILQKEIIAELRNHPDVAWVERNNSGAFKLKHGGYIRCGWLGVSDLIGQMKDGRFLAIEVKTPAQWKDRKSHTISKEQAEFLSKVDQAGGVAGACYSTATAMQIVNGLTWEGRPI